MTVKDMLRVNIEDVSHIKPIFMSVCIIRFDIGNFYSFYLLKEEYEVNQYLGKYLSMVNATHTSHIGSTLHKYNSKYKLEDL